ncbi:receptor-like protein EIX2 [Cornus florida]|uniref:receptor-like protein EIX2 n=1 Tax=Cornus florida TaxID=4283 RepID=UPI0028979317|nr:receptor-like protein EIX2 [Cornus florida]XP_059655333.1 receptor-like protein EIX2 [Cornus florida]
MRTPTRTVLVILFTLLFIERFGVGLQQNGDSYVSCIESEINALIKFRGSLIDNSNHLSSWDGEDCCTWTGVSCSNRTGKVVKLDLHNMHLQGQINPSILNLSHLHYIDLSNNDFSGTQILKFLGSLTNLRHLNLSNAALGGKIPRQFGNLSSLQYLDLHMNSFDGPIPDTLERLSSLEILDLSSNSFLGSIPSEMGNATRLTFLDLSNNELEGEVPRTLMNLCNLHIFDLSNNKFRGNIPILGGNTSTCLRSKLKELRLGSNQFSGFLPNQLGEFENLEYLLLYSNSFSGPIPASLGRLSSLKWLDFSDNQLNGNIPTSVGQLSKLLRLDISSNSLDGVVSESHFSNLINLNELSMSSNLLAVDVSTQWIPPFQLKYIKMASCKLGQQFPAWLRTQSNVEELIISNAGISDTIPDWFENVYSHTNYLDISHNQIIGEVPKFLESNGTNRELILNSNKFEGRLTLFPSNVVLLDLSNNSLSGYIPQIDNRNVRLEILTLSNNQLSGGIPTYLCKITTMRFIDLSKNKLSGKLPWCMGDLYRLEVLDLSNNSLYGEMPSSLGSLQQLNSLHLRGNKFHGELPLSLQNLAYLHILDLSENGFTDIIPPWIGEKLSYLKFLNLKSNNFYGDISALCNLFNLQLLNLAHNNITGDIPPCFGSFTAMVFDHRLEEYEEYGVDINYRESILDSMKGREFEFTKILSLLTSIDLSNNHLVGNIPEELMNLSGLVSLNVAGNHLKGRIPENIGRLEQLQSLDLSRNELSGSIPQSLSALYYLSRLNLSCNNLSGRIPTGYQLQTLEDASIYMGNNGLCGPPPLKSCSVDELSNAHEPVHESKGGDESEILWFYAGIGPGFLVGFLGVCGILHFKRSWRYAYFQLVENMYNKLSLTIALKTAWVRRKFGKDNFGK